MGSDISISKFNRYFMHFNPRSPHGERRVINIKRQVLTSFQSTLPAWGATYPHSRKRHSKNNFNPRSPHGERRKSIFTPDVKQDFNPRSPHGERLGWRLAHAHDKNFNPRSPHGERPVLRRRRSRWHGFQSTLPAWGATCLNYYF